MEAIGTPARDRIEAGSLLAGAGAVLLLVALFIDWFEPGVTAWTVFEALDLFLAACAAVVLAYAARLVGFTAVRKTAATLAGVAAFVVVVSQLIDPPPVVFDRDLEAGAWLALCGAGLMLVGAVLSHTGMSFAVVIERRGAAPRAAPPTEQPTQPLPPRDEPRI